jgi:hypothetical protein
MSRKETREEELLNVIGFLLLSVDRTSYFTFYFSLSYGTFLSAITMLITSPDLSWFAVVLLVLGVIFTCLAFKERRKAHEYINKAKICISEAEK